MQVVSRTSCLKLLSYTRLVDKKLSASERLRIESEKNDALRNRVKKAKSKGDMNVEDGEDFTENMNPHHCDYEPVDYEGADEKYGIVFCDTDMVRKRWFLQFLVKLLCTYTSLYFKPVPFFLGYLC